MTPLLVLASAPRPAEDGDEDQGLHGCPQALMDAVLPVGTSLQPWEEQQQQKLSSTTLQPGNQQVLADAKQNMKSVTWSSSRDLGKAPEAPTREQHNPGDFGLSCDLSIIPCHKHSTKDGKSLYFCVVLPVIPN